MAKGKKTIIKEIKKIDDEILKILDDMVDTMKDAQGVGLAAPQVGVNKTMFVVEVGDGKIRKVINPEFIEFSAEIVENEDFSVRLLIGRN